MGIVRTGGKVVGFWDETKHEYRKKVKRSIHFLWSLKSWGIDESIVKGLVERKCERVVIIDTEEQATLTSAMEDWTAYGVVRELGHGRQRFLADCHMRRVKWVDKNQLDLA